MCCDVAMIAVRTYVRIKEQLNFTTIFIKVVGRNNMIVIQIITRSNKRTIQVHNEIHQSCRT